MPVQTTNTDYVYFPDGCKVEVSSDSGSTFIDLGAMSGGAAGVLNYNTNAVNTGNAGQLEPQISAMTLAVDFVLINLNPATVEKMGGGMFETVSTDGSANTDVPDQVLSSGEWSELQPINLEMQTSSSDTTLLRASAEPTLTSVTGSEDGILAADDDYTLVVDNNAYGGYSIVLNTAGTSLTTEAQDITIEYESVTPIASTTLYCGESTVQLSPRIIRFTHTDDSDKVRRFTVFAADVNSGGFTLSFKGANEDGTEEMPLSLTGRIDEARTSGRQLFSYYLETGAK